MSDGSITLRGEAGPVRVRRGRDGVVRIEAETLNDTQLGLGYCHARDRGLQMLLVRTLGRGRACELFPPTAETLAIDRFFRMLNFGSDAESEAAALTPRARAAVDAYCRGVNHRFDTASIPWELRILGARWGDDPWTAADIFLSAKVIGYVNLGQSQGDLERWLVECVQRGVSRAGLEELFPGQLDGLDEELIRQVQLEDRLIPSAVLPISGLPRATASNNWVVAGSKSASGLPILCNDPHLDINRLPAVWYEAVLRWRSGGTPRYAIGATMPGIPSMVIGRTPELAWGVTYGFMDCVDSWVEDCRDGMYRRGEEWLPFRTRTEVIRRKGDSPLELTFYENDHGVLEGNPHEPGFYLTTRWSCGEATSAESADGLIGMLEATTVEEGRPLLAQVTNSSWNWVLADRHGDIGYQMSGRMPLRREGASGLVPLPGWELENDWQGFARFEELPRALNPPEGFLATANDDLNALGERKPINCSAPAYRGERIRQVLAGSDTLTVDRMKDLQHDLHSTQVGRFLAILRPVLRAEEPTEAGRLLLEWDGDYHNDSKAAFVFERFYRRLVEEAFAGDEEEGFGLAFLTFTLDRTSCFVDFFGNFDRILLAESSAWFGGRTREEVYRAAWSKVAHEADLRPYRETRQVVLKHLLFGGKLPRFLGFDRGPIVLKGSRSTVHQGQIHFTRGRESSFAPSYQMIADLATDQLETTLPGGPSDRRFSRWYASDLDDWLNGRYKTLQGFGD